MTDNAYVLSVKCPSCGIEPGFQCRTLPTGVGDMPLHRPHQGRFDAYHKWKESLKPQMRKDY